VTTVGKVGPRCRLYEAYASQHAGSGGDEAAALVCRRGSRTLLPPPAVGFDWEVVITCYQIALAAVTSVLRCHIVTQNVTFATARAR